MKHKPIQFKDIDLIDPHKTSVEANRLPNHLDSFIWHFLKPYRAVVVLFILLALLAGFWGPFNSLLVKSFINTLASKTSMDFSSLY